MNYTTYIPVIILFVIIFISYYSEKLITFKVLRNKRKGRDLMNEIIRKYIGKDCLVYLSLSSSVVSGEVISLNDNWLTVLTKDGEETINIDYIIRIKEHPVNKNGKKKSVIF